MVLFGEVGALGLKIYSAKAKLNLGFVSVY
jgi:hypothetical protein